MSLLRALQRQGILADAPAPPPSLGGAEHPISQTLTTDSSSNPLCNGDDSDANGSAAPAAKRASLSTLFRRDNLTVGTRVIIAQDADLRGEISVGSGTVIHPKATLLALQGPISIGSNCIIEETAVIVNRKSTPMRIGDNNLFEVGCRIEAASVGSYNVFEVRSKVAHNIRIGSYSVVGAGCTVLPRPITDEQLAGIFDDKEEEAKGIEQHQDHDDEALEGSELKPKSMQREEEVVFEELPDRTVVFGADSRRRFWSGEGAQQQAALHAKHLEYLRDAIPRTHKLKLIQGVRVAPSPAAAP